MSVHPSDISMLTILAGAFKCSITGCDTRKNWEKNRYPWIRPTDPKYPKAERLDFDKIIQSFEEIAKSVFIAAPNNAVIGVRPKEFARYEQTRGPDGPYDDAQQSAVGTLLYWHRSELEDACRLRQAAELAKGLDERQRNIVANAASVLVLSGNKAKAVGGSYCSSQETVAKVGPLTIVGSFDGHCSGSYRLMVLIYRGARQPFSFEYSWHQFGSSGMKVIVHKDIPGDWDKWLNRQ